MVHDDVAGNADLIQVDVACRSALDSCRIFGWLAEVEIPIVSARFSVTVLVAKRTGCICKDEVRLLRPEEALVALWFRASR